MRGIGNLTVVLEGSVKRYVKRGRRIKFADDVKAGSYQEMMEWPEIKMHEDNDGATDLPTGRTPYDGDDPLLLSF